MRNNTDAVLKAFVNGEQLSSKQIASRFNIVSPRSIIHTLRNEGHAIYLERYTNSKNQPKTKYRLGKPMQHVVAAGIAALGAKEAGLA